MTPVSNIQAPSFRIVSGQEADLPELETAHQDCFPEDAWSQDTLQGLLTLPGYHLRLSMPQGTEDRRLSGFCLFRTAADEAEIITLGVIPSARRRGLARALLQDFTDQACLAGARHLFLEVAEDNGSAVALYQHAGFAVSGRRPGYYDHGRTQPVDALIMEYHLY
ncbi:GNAT family N-acetyltransferase [Fodinicurvata sediminis]|uniref:GNAT family N-acetyltransferase n=1 Tax=Fodinicurvata sediminis TaxID=1121832 RepID=UPI0003B5E1EC|nr:GNAT family N-acetyltransferase [Fodinicurvata sediminis]